MKKVKVNYEGLSNEDLANSGSRVSNNAKQDIDVLSPLGVTPTLLARLDENIVRLRAIPYYQFFVGEKSKTTLDRNDSIANLKQTIKEFRTQTMFVESISTGEHKATFSVSYFRADAAKMIKIASLMLNVLNNSTEDLSLYGITSERISFFEGQINDLISKTVTQEQKTIALKTIAYDCRAEKAEVTKLLKFVAETGKVYWANKNSNKYVNYVITKSSASSAKAAEQAPESSQTEMGISSSVF